MCLNQDIQGARIIGYVAVCFFAFGTPFCLRHRMGTLSAKLKIKLGALAVFSYGISWFIYFSAVSFGTYSTPSSDLRIFKDSVVGLIALLASLTTLKEAKESERFPVWQMLYHGSSPSPQTTPQTHASYGDSSSDSASSSNS